MEEKLIAPCGMNCGVCVSYLAMKNELKKKGFSRKYCDGCLPRGKNCTFMASQCDLLGKDLLRFCYECENFPYHRLKNLSPTNSLADMPTMISSDICPTLMRVLLLYTLLSWARQL